MRVAGVEEAMEKYCDYDDLRERLDELLRLDEKVMQSKLDELDAQLDLKASEKTTHLREGTPPRSPFPLPLILSSFLTFQLF